MKPPSGLEGLALAGTDFAAGLIDGMLDAVWLVDNDSLRITAANSAAGELMGVAAASLCGRPVASLCATPEDEFFWHEAAAGRAQVIESQTLVRRMDGSTVPVTRRVSRLALGAGASCFVVVLHDRSERCRVESQLEERVAELAATRDA